ncbi:23S rRNA (guanosine(2251)-2'-O)-methyltransferase RlmB [Tumebacillus avium]|uniref:23S rRNA (Guanosine(2251)-2'-O)-methyltransferase RlmB n=2 Tax=Tumebacillus avium TaxID=1903704 RepID=A0A1Y0ILX0_9BACL|nr:23S rRNA (guanosine(2251)-2'-O)-methyltransferase RlmB [Tumebacillus avium]
MRKNTRDKAPRGRKGPGAADRRGPGAGRTGGGDRKGPGAERKGPMADRRGPAADRDRERERVVRPERIERDQVSFEGGNEQVEGRHPVMEALRAGREINKILVAEGAQGSITELLGKARSKNIIIQTVPRTKLDQISEGRNHQGIIAYIAAKEYVELDVIVQAANNSPRPGLIVVLDEIEDPHNLGSILRTADGVGAHGVIIPKRRAVPLTATVAKASAGAIEHVPVARVANISQTIEQLKKDGYWVVGTDVDGENMYHQVEMTGPTVLVIGNEGKGLGEVVKKRCDYLVRLPMVGQVQSLNAGVATGILLYEVLRQRGEKK